MRQAKPPRVLGPGRGGTDGLRVFVDAPKLDVDHPVGGVGEAVVVGYHDERDPGLSRHIAD